MRHQEPRDVWRKNRCLRTIPLTNTQLLFWMVYITKSDTANLVAPLHLEGEVDVKTLQGSVDRLFFHHEVLRASIPRWNPVQTITDSQPPNIEE